MSSTPSTAIILTGHGSLRSASGASMLRLAARLREQGIAKTVKAAFLNFSRPTLKEAFAQCIDGGASEIVIQPYFLIAGHVVADDLPRQICELAASYPAVHIARAEPILDHPLLIDLVVQRAREATTPRVGPATALLLIAHGTPQSEANWPIYRIAAGVAARTNYASVDVCFMESNSPDIATAIGHATARGAEQIVALPYFLHLGRHTREDLPRLIASARTEHAAANIILGPHLGYDAKLADIMVARIRSALQPMA